MIFWNEYKVLKVQADKMINDSMSDDLFCLREIIKYLNDTITREQCVENIINILSDGKHFQRP